MAWRRAPHACVSLAPLFPSLLLFFFLHLAFAFFNEFFKYRDESLYRFLQRGKCGGDFGQLFVSDQRLQVFGPLNRILRSEIACRPFDGVRRPPQRLGIAGRQRFVNFR